MLVLNTFLHLHTNTFKISVLLQKCVPKKIKFGLVSLFIGISTFVGYLMPNPSFKKNGNGTI